MCREGPRRLEALFNAATDLQSTERGSSSYVPKLVCRVFTEDVPTGSASPPQPSGCHCTTMLKVNMVLVAEENETGASLIFATLPGS
jgi:hypothetical protein